MSKENKGLDGEGFAERVGRAAREVKDDLTDTFDGEKGDGPDSEADGPLAREIEREKLLDEYDLTDEADNSADDEAALATAAALPDAQEEPLMLADEDERLPWLESDEDYEDEGFDMNRLVVLGLVALVALLGLLGLIWVLSQPSTDEELLAQGSTIEAPDGPFRTTPENPGGSEVAGTGDMSFEVGEGQSREARLANGNQAAGPSIDRAQGTGASADGAASAGASEAGASADVANADGSSSATSATSSSATSSSGTVAVQVAAYSSRARAEQGWRDLSNRFEALQGLSHRVEEANVDGATVYRLQALTGSASNADGICRSVRAAGGDCQVKR